MLQMKAVMRVNPKSSHHKGTFSYFLNVVSIRGDGCSLHLLSSSPDVCELNYVAASHPCIALCIALCIYISIKLEEKSEFFGRCFLSPNVN